jgi:hypothetical protein
MLNQFFVLTTGGLWAVDIPALGIDPCSQKPMAFTRLVARGVGPHGHNHQADRIFFDWRNDLLLLSRRPCAAEPAEPYPYVMIFVTEKEARSRCGWQDDEVRIHAYSRGEVIRAFDGVEDHRFQIVDKLLAP